MALIKPQFEVDAKHLDRSVVRDDAHRQSAIDKVMTMVKELDGADVIGITESPIRGPKGNVEYLLGISRI